jgi:hypothetical protein
METLVIRINGTYQGAFYDACPWCAGLSAEDILLKST